jgi:hypothetical protein
VLQTSCPRPNSGANQQRHRDPEPAASRRQAGHSTTSSGPATITAPPTIIGLGRDVASGLIVAFIAVAYYTSFSALIFSGELVQGLGLGLNAMLLGGGISAS